MFQKLFILILVVTAGLAASSGPVDYHGTKSGDIEMLMKQKKIFELLMYVNQNELLDAEYFEIGRSYDLANQLDHYNNKEIVMMFMMRWSVGMLNREAIFSYYNEQHREEMMMLYQLFYSAKDFMTFYQIACWARIHMNPGMFVAAFTTAVIYRDDCKYMRLPAVHEIYPNMFFDNKLIREAYRVAMTRRAMSPMKGWEDMYMDDSTYYLNSNSSNMWMTMMKSDPMAENSLAYFTDDVSMNAYYYYMRMIFPFWISTKDHNVPKMLRGEMYYFLHQQLFAKYMLERWSNGLSEMPESSWYEMNMPVFQTNLVYGNGVPMPRRDWWNVLPWYKHKYLEYLNKLEIRIMEAIDSGFVIDNAGKQISLKSPEGLNILVNLIEGNYDSVNEKYYGSWEALARKVFGMYDEGLSKNSYVPSSLDLFSTSLRDPAFYRIMQKMMSMILRGMSLQKRYTQEELEFQGVKIENVEMSKLMTYWQEKEYLINNAIDVASMKDGKSFNIKVVQPQLNYKPFTYKMNINSDKAAKGVMRIFLGPAVESSDLYSYMMNYHQYFFMLDEFEINLKEGMNNIERNSGESKLFKSENMTGDKFYKLIMQAIEGKEPMSFEERMWGFPQHMMLPKGNGEGMKFKLFFYIGAYENAQVMEFPILGKRTWYGKSLGFPLDRPMQPWIMKLSNMYLKDVYIYNMVDKQMMEYNQSPMSGNMAMSRDMVSKMKDLDKMNMSDMRWSMKHM